MTTMPMQRPFLARTDDLTAWHQRINWRWWLIRTPMFLLAAPAAYGVGAFAAEKLPLPVAVLAGMAFEAAYIGAIAGADQLSEEGDWQTTALWWLINGAAVIASVLSNLLFFAGGTYAGITAEVATHAVPLPVLGFFYGLYVHRVAMLAERSAARASEAADKARAAVRYGCTRCAGRWPERSGYHGHKRHSCQDGAIVDHQQIGGGQ